MQIPIVPRGIAARRCPWRRVGTDQPLVNSPKPFRAFKRHEEANSTDGLDELPYKELSPAAREVFKEAQKNILALNGSRMRALQELKRANEKIAELERRLEKATLEISSLAKNTLDVPETSNRPQTAVEYITLQYVTGWKEAFLHFQVDDQPWTSLPGLRMEHLSPPSNQGANMTLKVSGKNLRFVVTDGAGNFDTPNPFGDPNEPKNYEIHEPGTYLLQSGKIKKLDG